MKTKTAGPALFAILTIPCLTAPAPAQTAPAAPAPAAVPAPGYELTPTLSASQLLPPAVVTGPKHTVRENVETIGLSNSYIIDTTDQGTIYVQGDELIAERVREIYAIDQLKNDPGLGDFVKGVTGTTKKELGLAGKLLFHPVQTVGGIPKGVSLYVKRTSDKAGGQANGNYEGGPIKDWLKVDAAKREIAAKFGVDPYSSNEALQHELDRASIAASAGEYGIRLLVPGDSLLILSEEGNIDPAMKDVYELSSSDLFRVNGEALTAMGVSDDVRDRFLAHRDYNPAQETFLIRALQKLDGVPGRAEFIELSLTANDGEAARFFEHNAQLMALYHQHRAPVQSIVFAHNFAMLYTADKRLVVPLHIDYAAWTQIGANFLKALFDMHGLTLDVATRELIISGTASALAKQQYATQNITLIEHAFQTLSQPQ